MALDGEIFLGALTALIADLPLFIVWLGGLVFAIIRWKKSPHSSLFALLGIIVIAVTHIFQSIFSYTYPVMANINGVRIGTISTVSAVVTIITNCLRAAGWLLILLAVFGKKETKSEA
jgi:hypothetical protein